MLSVVWCSFCLELKVLSFSVLLATPNGQFACVTMCCFETFWQQAVCLYARGHIEAHWPLCFVNHHLLQVYRSNFSEHFENFGCYLNIFTLLMAGILNKIRAQNLSIGTHIHECIRISHDLLQENSKPLASWQSMHHADVQTISSTPHPDETYILRLVKNIIITAMLHERQGLR